MLFLGIDLAWKEGTPEKPAAETGVVALGGDGRVVDAGLRVATMHRVKGLEFSRMVIAGVNDGTVPLSEAMKSDDEAVREEGEAMERALLYVAATRAKRELLMTRHGVPSSWLAEAPSSGVGK